MTVIHNLKWHTAVCEKFAFLLDTLSQHKLTFRTLKMDLCTDIFKMRKMSGHKHCNFKITFKFLPRIYIIQIFIYHQIRVRPWPYIFLLLFCCYIYDGLACSGLIIKVFFSNFDILTRINDLDIISKFRFEIMISYEISITFQI